MHAQARRRSARRARGE